VSAKGYAFLAAALLLAGFLLTHPLSSSVGRWDERVNDYFAHHRTGGWNSVTSAATSAFNTLSVVCASAVVLGALAIRRLWHEAAFLLLALLLEITVFLSVTFLVARPRPAVVRLNSTPSTSSFPSGHTAAATVLFAGLAIIVACCTTNLLARVSSGIVAGLISVMVGFARVYRGLHHPSDVLFGMLLGLGCVLVSVLAVRAASRVEQLASAGPNELFLIQNKRLTGPTAVSTTR
jgi:undecaprenyl-diphosphatase